MPEASNRDTMETIKVRERTETKIVFASTEDMKLFLDQILNGQGVIFEYVEGKTCRKGEYITPAIATSVQDGKIELTSKEER